MPQNAPPTNHLTPPPKDLVRANPYTEKRKFDDGIMEDFPPEKKQRLQNFPLANGIGKCVRFRLLKPGFVTATFDNSTGNSTKIVFILLKIFTRKYHVKIFE